MQIVILKLGIENNLVDRFYHLELVLEINGFINDTLKLESRIN